jgi:chromosome segregation ATPase
MAKSPNQLRQSAAKKEKISAEIQELEKQNSTLLNEKAELEKKYATLEREHANLKIALASTDKYNRDVAKTTEYTSNKGRVVNPSLIHRNFISIPADKLGDMTAEIQELEKKNGTLLNEKAKLEKEYANLKTINDRLSPEKAKLEKENANLKTALANNKCPISSDELLLKEKYAALKIKYADLKTTLTRTDEKLKTAFAYNETPFKASYDYLKSKVSASFDSLKRKFSNAHEKLKNKTITTDKVNKKISINSEKNAYDILSPTIEKIKSEYFFSNNTGSEVKKDIATSINQRDSNTKCFEIMGSSLKSLESESSDCEKIYSLHNFLDSVGIDKVDASVIDNFNSFIKRYSYADKDGKKVIKYTDDKDTEGKECFKMENEKVSTYGENLFSDECAPLINLYIFLQIANGKEIWHYENYDLKDYDDAEFYKILDFEFADN